MDIFEIIQCHILTKMSKKTPTKKQHVDVEVKGFSPVTGKFTVSLNTVRARTPISPQKPRRDAMQPDGRPSRGPRCGRGRPQQHTEVERIPRQGRGSGQRHRQADER